MRIIKISILIPLLLFSIGMQYNPSNIKLPIVNCHSAILLDQASGRILYGKNQFKLLPMASTTKIMTAIVAIEKGNLKDQVIVSKRAASVSGSSVGLKAGDKITLEELLYGLMLRSGNDAAIAIAEHIGGSVEQFAELMNYKALEMGAYDTSFSSPHGLDDENHYTTAYDLAKITSYAMKNKFFTEIVQTKSISAGITGKFSKGYSNINKFLFSFRNADGVKTGYTGRAGKCLVASVNNGSERLIAVILNSNNRFSEAGKLMEYGFKTYKINKIMDKGKVCTAKFKSDKKAKYFDCYLKEDVYLPMNQQDTEKISKEINVPSIIYNIPKSDSIIGNLSLLENGNLIAKYPIYIRGVTSKN